MPVDYHMHTTLSVGKHTHLQMVRAASQQGLQEVGISDHVSLKPVGWAMPLESIPVMIASLERVKQEAGGLLSVRFGLEMDFIPGLELEIAHMIDRLKPDYVIGSVHFIGSWNFDSDTAPYPTANINSTYQRYFELVHDSARSGLFDIIGHCDLVKKFGYRPTTDLEALYTETARVLKEADVVVELNTSGLGKPCQEFYPGPSLLSKLAQYRVPITLGSDAHAAEHVGQYFIQAINELKALGYSEVVRFEGRGRETIRI